MATEKVAKVLRVRTDLTEEQIQGMTDSQAWTYVYALDQEQKALRDAQAGPKRIQICFTGFGTSERAELEAKATRLEMEVKSSVTKTLRYLCTGPDAGPSKLTKAEEQGVMILSPEQFHALCETGEVPY